MISFNFVSPVAGVLLGVAILGERVSAGLLGGMALVPLGLALIARRRKCTEAALLRNPIVGALGEALGI